MRRFHIVVNRHRLISLSFFALFFFRSFVQFFASNRPAIEQSTKIDAHTMLFAIYFFHLMWNSTLNEPKYLFKFADECNLVPRAFSLAWGGAGKTLAAAGHAST